MKKLVTTHQLIGRSVAHGGRHPSRLIGIGLEENPERNLAGWKSACSKDSSFSQSVRERDKERERGREREGEREPKRKRE